MRSPRVGRQPYLSLESLSSIAFRKVRTSCCSWGHMVPALCSSSCIMFTWRKVSSWRPSAAMASSLSMYRLIRPAQGYRVSEGCESKSRFDLSKKGKQSYRNSILVICAAIGSALAGTDRALTYPHPSMVGSWRGQDQGDKGCSAPAMSLIVAAAQ